MAIRNTGGWPPMCVPPPPPTRCDEELRQDFETLEVITAPLNLDGNLPLNPLLNPYILAKVFSHFDNSSHYFTNSHSEVESLKNFRLVCKIWNEEASPSLFKQTWITNLYTAGCGLSKVNNAMRFNRVYLNYSNTGELYELAHGYGFTANLKSLHLHIKFDVTKVNNVANLSEILSQGCPQLEELQATFSFWKETKYKERHDVFNWGARRRYDDDHDYENNRPYSESSSEDDDDVRFCEPDVMDRISQSRIRFEKPLQLKVIKFHFDSGTKWESIVEAKSRPSGYRRSLFNSLVSIIDNSPSLEYLSVTSHTVLLDEFFKALQTSEFAHRVKHFHVNESNVSRRILSLAAEIRFDKLNTVILENGVGLNSEKIKQLLFHSSETLRTLVVRGISTFRNDNTRPSLQEVLANLEFLHLDRANWLLCCILPSSDVPAPVYLKLKKFVINKDRLPSMASILGITSGFPKLEYLHLQVNTIQPGGVRLGALLEVLLSRLEALKNLVINTAKISNESEFCSALEFCNLNRELQYLTIVSGYNPYRRSGPVVVNKSGQAYMDFSKLSATFQNSSLRRIRLINFEMEIPTEFGQLLEMAEIQLEMSDDVEIIGNDQPFLYYQSSKNQNY